MATKLLQGIAPALVTPFTADNQVDVVAVDAMVQFHIAAGVCGFYLCGSTGEGLVCTVAERQAMTAATMDSLKKHNSTLPVVVMVASANVEDAVALAQHAESVGAHAVSSIMPPGQAPSLKNATTYWQTVAGATKLPFYVYWIAGQVDPSSTPETFLAAMKTVPNFAGLKFTDKNFYCFQQIVDLSHGELNCVTGPDEMMGAGLMMSSDGAIGSTYNIHPKLAVRLYKAFMAGDVKTAKTCQVEMNRNIAVLLDKCRCHERGTNIVAGIKAIYRRKYGIEVGKARSEAAIEVDDAWEADLMQALEGHVFE